MGIRVGSSAAILGLAVLAVLAGGCASASSGPNATPTMSPSPVPVLGKMTFRHFPPTYNGMLAIQLCEGWAQVRGQYVTAVRKDTPRQLDIWFSQAQWAPMFSNAYQLEASDAYNDLTLAFSLVSVPALASIGNARKLDAACAG